MSSKRITAFCFWGAEGKSLSCALSIFSVDCFFPHFEQEQEHAYSDMENVLLKSLWQLLTVPVQKSLDLLFPNLPFSSSQKSWRQFLCSRSRSILRRISLRDSFVQKVAFMFLVFFHRGSSNPAAAPQITVGLCNLCCCFHTNKWNKSNLCPQWRVWGFFSALYLVIWEV